MLAHRSACEKSADVINLDHGIAELALLVPSWQAQALLEAAQAQGLTVGQYMRRLLDRVLPPAPKARFGS